MRAPPLLRSGATDALCRARAGPYVALALLLGAGAACDVELVPGSGSCAGDPCAPGCLPDCGRCPTRPGCRACDDAAACFTLADCGDPGERRCAEGCCVPRCAEGACAGEGACGADVQRCVCEDGACVAAACLHDGDCGEGARCEGGGCTREPLPVAVACELLLRAPATVVGREIAFEGVALDGAGERLAGALEVNVAPNEPAELLNGEAELHDGLARGLAEGTVTLRAAPGCEARLRVLAPPADGERLVFVWDEASGLPPEGALVQLGDAAPVPLPADGVLRAAAPDGPLTLSIFAPEHDHVSYVGVQERVLFVPLARSVPPGEAGGFTGRPFAGVSEGLVEVALAGASLPERPEALSGAALVGRRFATPIDALGVEVGLSAGLAARLPGAVLRERFFAEGPPCAAPPCRSAGWMLQARLPAEELPLQALLSERGFADRSLLLLPYVQRGTLSHARSIDYTPAPLVRDALGRRRPDLAAATERIPAAERDLRVPLEVTLPPRPAGLEPGGLLVTVAVREPGRGLLPRALAAAHDADGDGVGEDPAGRPLEALPLRFAPHPAGGALDVLALAVTNDPGGFRAVGCEAAVAGSCRQESLLRGPLLSSGAFAFPRGFLPPPTGVRVELDTRRVRLGEGSDATLLRLEARGVAGRRHVLWIAPGGEGAAVWPRPPAPLDDRLVLQPGVRGALLVQALVGPSGVGPLLAPEQGPDEVSRATIALATRELP